MNFVYSKNLVIYLIMNHLLTLHFEFFKKISMDTYSSIKKIFYFYYIIQNIIF